MLCLKFIFIIYYLLINVNLSFQICIKGENLCSKCNYMTNLCIKCDLNIYIPDKYGGCEPSKKCILGQNYCNECSDEQDKCKICEEGFFPDENGGCTYTDNCKISYKGECLECKNNFILIGKHEKISSIKNNFILCKSLASEDIKNCEEINMINGVCSKCKEGFYLNEGDNRCTKSENCYESSFGICTKCKRNYYLNKKENKCFKQDENIFYRCQESIDGKKCDLCDEDFYLSEDGQCVQNNFCKKTNTTNYDCSECISGYYTSEYHSICASSDNCYLADRDTGLCLDCIRDYCLDHKDGKCKSNKQNNKLLHCRTADEFCFDCYYPYFLGEDSKCSSSRYCAESESGICILCSDDYYLGKDNKCTNVENCLFSDNFRCVQCIENYYFNINEEKCLLEKGGYMNCQETDYKGEKCGKCREGFYLNLKDNLCYNNNEFGDFYKCEETDMEGENCGKCVENYYLGKKYKKCTKFEGCEISLDGKKCDECDEDHVLNAKSGECIINNKIIDEDKQYYYKCNRTDEEDSECEICVNGYNLSDTGLCVDEFHCSEEINGTCKKCEKNEEDIFNYCLNKDFGCVETDLNNCLNCDDILDFNKCTKCLEKYKLNANNKCDKIKVEEEEEEDN